MNMLFIGATEKAFYIEEYAAAHNISIDISGYVSHISEAKRIMTEKHYDYIVVDIEQFIDHYNVITDELSRIRDISNAHIIIIAIGYSEHTEIIQALLKQHFFNFVTERILSKRKEQFDNCVNDTNYVFNIIKNNDIATPDVKLNEPILLDKDIETPKTKRSIVAVAGACHRIGTTTQALQIVKYLNYMGYKACYIEMNNNRYCNLLTTYFDVPDKDETGKITYQGVDLFSPQEKISEILNLDYDFYVYDCGCIKDEHFNLVSFVEKDYKIVVCGTKANELRYTNEAIERLYNTDCFYMYSFAHENEHEDVLEMMRSKADKTLFSIYTPDSYTYTSNANTIYDKIFTNISPLQPQKKKRFFSISRRNKKNG